MSNIASGTETAARPVTIAYLGPPGTFGEEALHATLADEAAGLRLITCETNREVVLAVESGSADAGFVPIENSVEGAVTETLDALVHEAPDTQMVGELVWPIHHYLIAGDGTALDQVTRVSSHPQALAQCAGWVHENLSGAQRASVVSTAEAVREAVDSPGFAAIGSRIAAETYGGTVLAEQIEDVSGNKTRFVWLAKRPLPADWLGLDPQAPTKTTVVFAGFNDTSPGALVSILSEFAYRSVNMSKIESRPERTQLGHYLFFVDLEGSMTDEPVANAIEAIRGKVRVLRVLGSFPAFEA
ncbi:MAG: prephenate dehydratase [Solirubrobacterales bacterium]